MKLEEQINRFTEIGITLNKGVSTDDLLLSYPRKGYENAPFDLILFVYLFSDLS